MEALGARIDAHLGDGVVLKRQVRSDGVYVSTPSRLVHFGLGDVDTVRRLVIEWPNGIHQERHFVPAGRLYRLTEPLASVLDVSQPRLADGGLAVAVTVADHSGVAQGVPLVLSLVRGERVVWSETVDVAFEGAGERVVPLTVPVPRASGLSLRVDVLDGAGEPQDTRLIEL